VSSARAGRVRGIDHRLLDVTTADLVGLGLLPEAAAAFVVAAFAAGGRT